MKFFQFHSSGYEIYDGIWIAGSQGNAFLLPGSEGENMIKGAIVGKVSDRQYETIPLSESVITYAEYAVGLTVRYQGESDRIEWN